MRYMIIATMLIVSMPAWGVKRPAKLRSPHMPEHTNADFDASMETTTHYHPDFCKQNWLWRRLRQLYTIRFLQSPHYSEQPLIPKIIHQYWGQGIPPEKYTELRESWIKHHPDWTYILWTDEDMQAFGLENKELYDATTNWGKKSDIARLEILYRFGGLYVDTDFECVRPFDVFHHCCDFYAGLNCGPQVLILNGLMGAAPGHPVIKRSLEKLKANAGVPDNYMTIMYGTGPGLITEAFRELTPTSKNRTVIFPSTYFYPWPYYMREEKDRAVIQSWIKPETFGIHHWHLSWNEGKIG